MFQFILFIFFLSQQSKFIGQSRCVWDKLTKIVIATYEWPNLFEIPGGFSLKVTSVFVIFLLSIFSERLCPSHFTSFLQNSHLKSFNAKFSSSNFFNAFSTSFLVFAFFSRRFSLGSRRRKKSSATGILFSRGNQKEFMLRAPRKRWNYNVWMFWQSI